MKTKTLSLIAIAGLVLGTSLLAQAPAGQPKAAVKSPADLAAEEFFKLRNDKAAKPDEERFKKLIAAGLAFIEENPTHGQINGVVNGLANFSDTMGDKNLAPHRANFRAKDQ